MSRKRPHSIALGKVVDNIEQWLDDEEEEEHDNLQELYG